MFAHSLITVYVLHMWHHAAQQRRMRGVNIGGGFGP